MANTFKFIAKEQLTSSAASITFSAIPQTYTDLMILFTARSNRASIADDTEIRINATTNGTLLNYYSLDTGTGQYSASGSYVGWSTSGASATSQAFGFERVYLTNYTSSASKAFQGTGGAITNVTNKSYMSKTVCVPTETAAVTSIVIAPGDGTQFPAYSRFYLYGIKRA